MNYNNLSLDTALSPEFSKMGVTVKGLIKQGFTDHNASRRSLILRSAITIADDNMQDQHCSCTAGYD